MYCEIKTLEIAFSHGVVNQDYYDQNNKQFLMKRSFWFALRARQLNSCCATRDWLKKKFIGKNV